MNITRRDLLASATATAVVAGGTITATAHAAIATNPDASIIADAKRFLEVNARIPAARTETFRLFNAIPADSRPDAPFQPRGMGQLCYPEVSRSLGECLVRYEALGLRNGLADAVDRESKLHDESSEIITRLEKSEPRTVAGAIALVRAMAAELTWCVEAEDWEGTAVAKIERTMERAAQMVEVGHV
jgi:hypothetical protein